VFNTFAQQRYASTAKALGWMLAAQGIMGKPTAAHTPPHHHHDLAPHGLRSLGASFGFAVGPFVGVVGSETGVLLPTLLLQAVPYALIFYGAFARPCSHPFFLALLARSCFALA
jgi:hypothetical protein